MFLFSCDAFCFVFCTNPNLGKHNMALKPIFEYSEDNMKSCIVQRDSEFLIFLNHDAAVDLQRGLYGLAYEYPYYEEVDVWSTGFLKEECVDLCEVTLVRDEDASDSSANKFVRHGIEQRRRLDVYATRSEANYAYKALSKLCMLSTKNYPHEVMIFNNIFVCILDN